MKLVFFDESKQDPGYPHYHIGAVCIDEADLADVEKRIAGITEKAFGTTEVRRDTELHGADIFNRMNNFKGEPDFGKRLDLLSDFADILSMPQALLIDIKINCKELQGAHSPEHLAFMFLVERANSLVKGMGSLGMLIGDRENDRISDRFSTTLSGYRTRGTDFAFGQDIGHLVDSVHFTHSHLSRFLQLADVYTWFLQFQRRNRDSKHERHLAVFKVLRRETVNLWPAKYKEWPKASAAPLPV
jgi:hypothetical protein